MFCWLRFRDCVKCIGGGYVVWDDLAVSFKISSFWLLLFELLLEILPVLLFAPV